jgi:hypothetical protein
MTAEQLLQLIRAGVITYARTSAYADATHVVRFFGQEVPIRPWPMPSPMFYEPGQTEYEAPLQRACEPTIARALAEALPTAPISAHARLALAAALTDPATPRSS